MSLRLGILPAAGRADRWGGYPKELLPLANNDTFLSRAVTSLEVCGCDFVIIVSNPIKIHLHAYHMRQRPNVQFAIQRGDEMWSAMVTAMDLPADEYFFMMPDTFIPDRPFPITLTKDFLLGVFETDEPGRFGMLRDGRVINKDAAGGPGKAWGALAWKRSVADFWRSQAFEDYTAAINGAIDAFGFGQWTIDFYHDIASMDYYARFLLSDLAKQDSGEAHQQADEPD